MRTTEAASTSPRDAVAEIDPLPRDQSDTKSWHVTLADGSTRSFAARGFRVDAGALVLLLPAGCVAAFAPGTWRTCESSTQTQTAAS
jgi:hypothetical protein